MMRTDGTGRLRFAGALLLAATFAVGALGGLAFGDLGQRDAVVDAREPDCDDHDGRRSSYLDRLELAPEQQRRIDAILEARKHQIDAFWAENGPRMEQIVDSARAEIRNVLTESQRAEVDRMRQERHERREREKQACAEKMKQDSVQESAG